MPPQPDACRLRDFASSPASRTGNQLACLVSCLYMNDLEAFVSGGNRTSSFRLVLHPQLLLPSEWEEMSARESPEGTRVQAGHLRNFGEGLMMGPTLRCAVVLWLISLTRRLNSSVGTIVDDYTRTGCKEGAVPYAVLHLREWGEGRSPKGRSTENT